MLDPVNNWYCVVGVGPKGAFLALSGSSAASAVGFSQSAQLPLEEWFWLLYGSLAEIFV